MDRIRSGFSNMIKSERYSRFTLQPTEDGERHAEVKLCDDATEAEAGGSPTFRPAHHSRRTAIYTGLAVLLIFGMGFLIGLLSHRTPQAECVSCAAVKVNETNHAQTTTTTTGTEQKAAVVPEPQLDWSTVTQILTERLSSAAFDSAIKNFDVPSRAAGSAEDMRLGNLIHKRFTDLEMDPWTDIHDVQLPSPDSQRPNLVEFDSDVFKPTGYLAYSASGRVQGKLVYGNYGRKEDLDAVQSKNVALKGSVVLLRAGNINFAEQVNNAALRGAAAVLIYPDSKDFNYRSETPLYGHVHLGSGDPYTPGFPSFNHTQFPPTQSAGLPKIPAQTITANMAATLLRKIGGPASDDSFNGTLKSVLYTLGGVMNATVEVNNVLVNKEIHNVFGVVKGFTDPDQYVVLGAQRDAWGPGYAKATVGSSVLMQLAETFRMMVAKKGFRPRRSVVFASFSAGEFGSVGATEWLEAHMTSIGKNVFAYISLDALVLGRGKFIASASPLLHSLLESTMKEVNSPLDSRKMYDMVGGANWEAAVLRPMTMDDPAYPFLAFTGIPSISFHFISSKMEYYTYFGTGLDNMDHLRYETAQKLSEMTALAAQLAGRMALRLVHDHLLMFDVSRYKGVVTKSVVKVYKRISGLTSSGRLEGVSPQWLNRARGSFNRAADDIQRSFAETDLTDKEACREINNKLMMIEETLLSPYVSATDTPFRHLLFGRGSHTLDSIAEMEDMKELHTQLALATWNLQGCANAMVGNIWDLDNQI
ncbi:unnamed protein product [Ophioblennius macclurei]